VIPAVLGETEEKILTLNSLSAKISHFKHLSSCRYSELPTEVKEKFKLVAIHKYQQTLRSLILNRESKTIDLNSREIMQDTVGKLVEILSLMFDANRYVFKNYQYHSLENSIFLSLSQILNFTRINCKGVVEEMEGKLIPQDRLELYRSKKKLIMCYSEAYLPFRMLQNLNVLLNNNKNICNRRNQDYFFKIIEDYHSKLRTFIPEFKHQFYAHPEFADHTSVFGLTLYLRMANFNEQVLHGYVDKEINQSIDYVKKITNNHI
jgi:hypothetical protein